MHNIRTHFRTDTLVFLAASNHYMMNGLKAEITKAVEKVQEAGATTRNSLYSLSNKSVFEYKTHKQSCPSM